LRHYATSWKIADSNPDEVIGFFNWPIVPAPGDYVDEEFGGMTIGRGK
jgi:hypothetical protein